MSMIALAINNVRQIIPYEVLQVAFYDQYNQNVRTPLSLDALIRAEVIAPRVQVDCNLVGGTQTTIPLINTNMEYIDPFNLVVNVPKEVTNGRSIIYPLNIQLMNYNNQYSQNSAFGQNNNSPLLQAGKAVMNSNLPTPNVTSAAVRLIGENTVLVNGGGFNALLLQTAGLLCMLENEAEMSNIKPTSAHNFFRLVELATKAYIYRKMIIRMDQGVLQGGFNIGALKDVISGYSDAEQMYQDYLHDTWRRVALHNDPESKFRHLRMISAGPR
jgi:hypothetical protein